MKRLDELKQDAAEARAVAARMVYQKRFDDVIRGSYFADGIDAVLPSMEGCLEIERQARDLLGSGTRADADKAFALLENNLEFHGCAVAEVKTDRDTYKESVERQDVEGRAA